MKTKVDYIIEADHYNSSYMKFIGDYLTLF